MSNATFIGIVVGGWILNAAIFRLFFSGKDAAKPHPTDAVGEAWWKDPKSL